jgi:hypothetical protein
MKSLPKLPTNSSHLVVELLAGGCVVSAAQVGKGDLSEWVGLMEAVEALCPVWPEVVRGKDVGDWRL